MGRWTQELKMTPKNFAAGWRYSPAPSAIADGMATHSPGPDIRWKWIVKRELLMRLMLTTAVAVTTALRVYDGFGPVGTMWRLEASGDAFAEPTYC